MYIVIIVKTIAHYYSVSLISIELFSVAIVCMLSGMLAPLAQAIMSELLDSHEQGRVLPVVRFGLQSFPCRIELSSQTVSIYISHICL